MPTVLLSSSFGGQRVQLFWSWLRTERGRSRLSASMLMIAASDTGAPWMPRMLVTVTFLPSDGWSITPSTPVPSACTHLSLGALANDLVAHHRPEGQQDVGVRRQRRRLGEVVGDVDLELGEALLEPRRVVFADVGRQREQDEQAGHETLSIGSVPPRSCRA